MPLFFYLEVSFFHVSYISVCLNLLLGQDTLVCIQVILGLLYSLKVNDFLSLHCRFWRVDAVSIGRFGHGPVNTYHGIALVRRDLLR